MQILGIALVVGFILAFILALNSKFQKVIKKLTDPLHFFPLSVVAYILLRPVIFPARSPDIGPMDF